MHSNQINLHVKFKPLKTFKKKYQSLTCDIKRTGKYRKITFCFDYFEFFTKNILFLDIRGVLILRASSLKLCYEITKITAPIF